ncbi:MAG: hypothetical protein EXR79_06115 [Myxococcales bacterium]|nr:hypothetical protein [Myxococcales bacterium]
MFEVRLKAFPTQFGFPHSPAERIERVVHKHSGGKLDHAARLALLREVAAGRPQIVARYAEEHAAHNVVAEFRLLAADAEVVTVGSQAGGVGSQAGGVGSQAGAA